MLAAEMNDAGHNVELSLRAWMCGLDVYTVPCSRVGVLNLRDPVKVHVHRCPILATGGL